jgi:SHS2 domain-containing protein
MIIHIMASKYKLINHTADIAVEIEAESIEELFKEAFNFWLNSVVEPENLSAKKKIEINLKAHTLEELLVDFINEVNFLLFTKKIVCLSLVKIKIDIDSVSLNSKIKATNLKNMNLLKEEIKSVTYHQLKLEHQNGKYIVMLVLDI